MQKGLARDADTGCGMSAPLGNVHLVSTVGYRGLLHRTPRARKGRVLPRPGVSIARRTMVTSRTPWRKAAASWMLRS